MKKEETENNNARLLENMEGTGRKIIVYETFFSYFFQERYSYGLSLIRF